MIRRALLPCLAAGIFFTLPAFADAPQLLMPLACRLGQDCWIVNYIDTDSAEGKAADPLCGPRTYDAHEGTDIGVRDFAAVRRGVDVLAAADGTVTRARDGAADRIPAPADIEALKAAKKGCGNGVLIEHSDGWQTIYCHMKQGSIAVKDGQAVKAGDRIGQVGYSGAAEFPHLHFGLFHAGKVVDPFTGAEDGAACGAKGMTLWQDKAVPRYEDFVLYGAGFSAAPPDFEKIKDDASAPETLASASLSSLSFWGAMFGVQAGDKIRLEITDAAGAVFAARDIEQERTRARQFYFIGRNVAPGSLPPGRYTGRMTLTRAGTAGGQPVTGSLERILTVTP